MNAPKIQIPAGNGHPLAHVKAMFAAALAPPSPAYAPEPPAMAFPLDIFPDGLAADIRELERCRTHPVDYSGVAALAVAAFSIGGAALLRLREGMEYPPIFYWCVVGEPNVNKTHPLNDFIRPLRKIERDLRTAWEKQSADYERACADAKAAKASPPEDANPGPPPAVVVTDSTLEAFSALMARNATHGVLLHADELRTWFKGFNAYRGGGSDESHWLTIWNGAPLSIQRLSRPAVYIPAPRCGVIGGVQPTVLTELTANGKANTGFLGRILFAYRDDLLARALPPDDSDPAIPIRWERCVERLYGLAARLSDPQEAMVLELTPEATLAHWEWERAICDDINDINASGDATESEQVGKMRTHVPRLALVLELLAWAWAPSNDSPPTHVGLDAMNGAIRVSDYFRETAAKVRERIDANKPFQPDARQSGFLAQLPADFTTAEAKAAGERMNVSDRTVMAWLKRWVRPTGPLVKVQYGHYAKRVSR